MVQRNGYYNSSGDFELDTCRAADALVFAKPTHKIAVGLTLRIGLNTPRQLPCTHPGLAFGALDVPHRRVASYEGLAFALPN